MDTTCKKCDKIVLDSIRFPFWTNPFIIADYDGFPSETVM